MYRIIRLAFYACIIILTVFFLKKLNKKRAKVSLIAISSLVLTMFSIYPVENGFYSFDSPEAVFQYVYNGTAAIDCVVPGQDSDLIVGNRLGNEIVFVAPKSESGWKIGAGVLTKSRSEIVGDGMFMTLYSYQGTADTYVVITIFGDDPFVPSDEYGSVFYRIKSDNEGDYSSYCARIPATIENYAIRSGEGKETA